MKVSKLAYVGRTHLTWIRGASTDPRSSGWSSAARVPTT